MSPGSSEAAAADLAWANRLEISRRPGMRRPVAERGALGYEFVLREYVDGLWAMETVHATTVAIDGAGVLLRGPSASGKSDLALRLIDRGARLVADDRTVLALRDGRVLASAPPETQGKMEVRGLGIVRVPDGRPAALRLVVDLVRTTEIERMPAAASAALLGVPVPLLRVDPFEPSAAAKVRLAMRLEPDEVER